MTPNSSSAFSPWEFLHLVREIGAPHTRAVLARLDEEIDTYERESGACFGQEARTGIRTGLMLALVRAENGQAEPLTIDRAAYQIAS